MLVKIDDFRFKALENNNLQILLVLFPFYFVIRQSSSHAIILPYALLKEKLLRQIAATYFLLNPLLKYEKIIQPKIEPTVFATTSPHSKNR